MYTKLVCNYCGNYFEKKTNEYNRCVKKGQKNYFCSRDHANKFLPRPHLKPRMENIIPGSFKDEYSDFKWYMKVVRNRCNKKQYETDISLMFLKHLWKEQEGKCALTQIPMQLRTHDSSDKLEFYTASLDRIDNTKRYTKDNVRFVCVMTNYARNTFSDNDFYEFIKLASKAILGKGKKDGN